MAAHHSMGDFARDYQFTSLRSQGVHDRVRRVRRGRALVGRVPAVPFDDTQTELSRLRSDVARPRLDYEILEKAAAYFARESW